MEGAGDAWGRVRGAWSRAFRKVPAGKAPEPPPEGLVEGARQVAAGLGLGALLGCAREAVAARQGAEPGRPFQPSYAWMFRVGNQGLRWALVCGGASAVFAGARGHLALARGADGPENSVGAGALTGATLGLFLPAPGPAAKLRASVVAAAGGALLCLPLAGLQALQAAEAREVAAAPAAARPPLRRATFSPPPSATSRRASPGRPPPPRRPPHHARPGGPRGGAPPAPTRRPRRRRPPPAERGPSFPPRQNFLFYIFFFRRPLRSARRAAARRPAVCRRRRRGGTQILVQNLHHQLHGVQPKLLPRQAGPFRVIEAKGNDGYRLDRDGVRVRHTHTADRLLPFNEPNSVAAGP